MAWLSDWAYRQEITVDNTNIDSDLTHFPVPIVLGTSVGQNNQDLSGVFTELGANSKKIAITKADGTTQLYGEIEQWDNVNEKAVIWVSKSDLTITSASTTTLYLYYDSSKGDNTTYIGDIGDAQAQNVWGAYQDVFHLQSGVNSSTSAGTSGNVVGTPSNIDTLLGKGYEVPDVSNYLEVPNYDLSSVAEGSFSFNIMFDTTLNSPGSHQFPFCFHHSDWSDRMVCRIESGNGRLRYIHYKGTNALYSANSSWTGGEWYVITVTNDNVNTKMYVNGVEDDSESDTKWFSDVATATTLYLGVEYYNNIIKNPLKGNMDEVRISPTAFSAAWIKADYYAQIDDLLIFGPVEDGAACVFDEADPYNVATYTPSDLFGACGDTCPSFDEADPYDVNGYTADPYGDCV